MRRVLVVEDETVIREFIVINLKRGGYETVEAVSWNGTLPPPSRLWPTEHTK